MMKRLLLILTLFSISIIGNTLFAQWTKSSGIKGADVGDILVVDSTMILCGTQFIATKQLYDTVWDVRLENNNGYKFVKTDSCIFCFGIYYTAKSCDKGENWEVIEDYSSIYRDLASIGNTLFTFDYDEGFKKSDDQANTWVTVSDNYYVDDAALFAVDSTLFIYPSNDSLFRSDDMGENIVYIPTTGLFLYSFSYILDIEIYHDSIYAATKYGFYVFINDSVGWQSRPEGIGAETRIEDLEIVNDTLFLSLIHI